MNDNIATVVFREDECSSRASGTWQYDYGQILRIQGLDLPKVVEIHFSLEETGGTSVTRIGTTKDSVTDVTIPDSMLENEGTDQNYKIYAFIYLSENNSGNTEHKITIPIKARPKPEVPGTPEEPELFRKAVEAVSEAAGRAEKAQEQAEAWTHGHEKHPECDTDNAKYYAKQAKKETASISGRVENGKKDIDSYIRQKKADLKGETGNVFFAAFRVVAGKLKLYSDPAVDKVRFRRTGSRLKYRLKM